MSYPVNFQGRFEVQDAAGSAPPKSQHPEKNALQKNLNFRRHMNRYQETRQDRSNSYSGVNNFAQGIHSPSHSQGDDMDTHERTASESDADADMKEEMTFFGHGTVGIKELALDGVQTLSSFTTKSIPVLASIATGPLIPQPYPGGVVAQNARPPFQDHLYQSFE